MSTEALRIYRKFVTPDGVKKVCAMCGSVVGEDQLSRGEWVCRPCMNAYTRFRRAYKRECGAYPTIDEYRIWTLDTPKRG